MTKDGSELCMSYRKEMANESTITTYFLGGGGRDVQHRVADIDARVVVAQLDEMVRVIGRSLVRVARLASLAAAGA